jgi:hypothetical protein
MSRQVWEVAETKFSSGASRVTWPDELNKIVQYIVKLKVKIIMYTGGTDIIMYLIVERVNYNLLELPQNIVGEL